MSAAISLLVVSPRKFPRAVAFACAFLAACHDSTPATTDPSAASSTTPVASAPPPQASSSPSAPSAPSSSSASNAGAAFEPQKVWAEGGAMGTHLAFAAYTQPDLDEKKIHALFEQAITEIKRIETLMTTWRPDSEISQINAAAGKNAVVVSQESFDVIQESVHTSEISEGTFDITFESLHGLWKFDQDLDPHPPTQDQIKKLLPRVGYKKLKLDPQAKSVMITTEGTKISLGGIAKGYGVDKAVAILDRAGLKSFYVQAGGDLFARGKKPDGNDWAAGVRDPRGREGSFFAMIALSDHSFSTAGDYERSYIVGGKRYHHIIDPRTGSPATASRSVTIWAKSALQADAIDDAVFILGPEKGLKLVESLDGVGAVIVDKNNKVWVSDRIKSAVQIVHPPTDAL